jgi:hypothetical protein
MLNFFRSHQTIICKIQPRSSVFICYSGFNGPYISIAIESLNGALNHILIQMGISTVSHSHLKIHGYAIKEVGKLFDASGCGKAFCF